MTTELIHLWTMEGAVRDSDGEERSADELRAALARRWMPPADERPRMRRADEAEWKPLLTGIDGDDERN